MIFINLFTIFLSYIQRFTMRKLALLIIFFLPISLFGQIDSLAGYLNDLDGPLAGETVTFINPFPEPVLVAEVETDETGYFITAVDSFPTDVDLQVETTACEDLDYGIGTAGDNQNIVVYDLYCNPPDDYPQVIIYGYPATDDGLTWDFWITANEEIESQTWSVNDENFETEVLNYTFEESGIGTVFITVNFVNGMTISTGSDFTVGEELASNCSAAFYFMEDSTDFENGTFYLMNASIGQDLEYLWTFTDDGIYTEQNPIHTFPEGLDLYTICLVVSSSTGCTDSNCIEIDGDFFNGSGRPAGIQGDAKDNGPTMVVLSPAFDALSNNEILEEKSASIFPNPSSGNFEMVLAVDEQDRGLLRLFDISGRIIDQQIEVLQPGSNRLSYSLNAFTGLYILEFRGERYYSRSRLVIE